jgi:lysozyme
MKSFKQTARWMTVCATFVGGFEGLYCTAYPDQLAHGLPTVCYGETEGVHLGDHYTPEQCADMLANKLPRYWHDIEPCIHVPVNDNEKIAFTSFAYNLGTGAFCKGQVAQRLNRGDHAGACNAMLAYDHASGRKIKGLTRRREAERKLCLTPEAQDADVAINLSPEAPPVVAPAVQPRPKAAWHVRSWHWLIGAN